MKALAVLAMAIPLFVVAACASVKEEGPVGGTYDKETMKSLVDPPKNIHWYLKPLLRYADSKAKKEMLTGKILSWSPKIAISSGLLEQYVEEGAAKILSPRMITLERLIISYTIPNAFIIDINAQNYQRFDITTEELQALQSKESVSEVNSFTEREKTALQYALAFSRTPVVLPQTLLDDLRRLFSEREIVALAGLSAKVNYWGRLIEALKVKPAGFTDDPLIGLED